MYKEAPKIFNRILGHQIERIKARLIFVVGIIKRMKFRIIDYQIPLQSGDNFSCSIKFLVLTYLLYYGMQATYHKRK